MLCATAYGDVFQDTQGNSYHTGLLPKSQGNYGEAFVTLDDCEGLPENFDLRELGVVPSVKNQGSCGSCWAFAKTSSLESATGNQLDLSEQQLVSCDRNNYGCNGGNLNNNEYQRVKGQGLEEAFPYVAKGVKCKPIETVARGSQFVYIGAPRRSPTVKELQCALYKSKTIPWMTVGANAGWTNVPKDPNFLYNECTDSWTNHAVGVVGWKTVDKKVYFIMKNSWGTKWGAEGYLNMPLGCDNLGQEAAYIVGALECKPPQVMLPVEVISTVDKEGTLEVTQETDVTYEWFHDEKSVSTTNAYTFKVEKDGEIVLVAKNKCGTTTVRTKVRLSH